MKCVKDGEKLTIALEGRIDANNAPNIDREIDALIGENSAEQIEFDAADLSYISSAGLRIILRILKQIQQVSIVNTSLEIYELFEMTGITELMEVRRAMREVSVDGLQLLGAGANGRVYRLDDEQIIKVFNPISNTEEKIFREREASRKAFVQGIPSAISFELVRVGDSYGIIYEMIDAHTLGETISLHPDRLEEYATRMARMLRQLHATEFEEGDLPDARLGLHAWADIAERSGLYSTETIAKVRDVINAIPQANTFVHGDFHPGNIMVADKDELLLIDMGDASMGNPIIDLCGSCQIMLVMQVNPQATKQYTGLEPEALSRVWNTFIRTYYDTDDDACIEAIEQRLRFYAVIRTMAGITFSKVIPDEKRPLMAKQVSDFFLAGYERYMAGQVPSES